MRRGPCGLVPDAEMRREVPRAPSSGSRRGRLELVGFRVPRCPWSTVRSSSSTASSARRTTTAGLSPGNVASRRTRAGVEPSRRRPAGAREDAFVRDLGVRQAVLPPHDRPSLATLRRLGIPWQATRRSSPPRRRRRLALRCAERVGDVDRERRDRRAFDRHGGRTRASDPGEPPADVPPSDRACDDHAHPPGRLRATPARSSSTIRFPAAGSLPTRGRPTTAPRDVARRGARLRVGPAARGAHSRPRSAPGPADPGGSRGARSPAPLDSARCLFPQQHPDGIDAGAFHTDVLAVGNGRSSCSTSSPSSTTRGRRRMTLRRALGEELVVVAATAPSCPSTARCAAYPFNSQVLTRGRRVDGHRRADRRARGRPRARAAR